MRATYEPNSSPILLNKPDNFRLAVIYMVAASEVASNLTPGGCAASSGIRLDLWRTTIESPKQERTT
jgi:hypothetical protein